MLRALVLASFIAIALSAHAQSIEETGEETAVLVEGHVFNLRTGTPIRNALVCPFPSTACGEVTDENGFFSLVVDLAFHDSLVASCLFQSRGKSETTYRSMSSLPTIDLPGRTLPPPVGKYLRRDFYLDVQRSSAQVHCLGPIV